MDHATSLETHGYIAQSCVILTNYDSDSCCCKMFNRKEKSGIACCKMIETEVFEGTRDLFKKGKEGERLQRKEKLSASDDTFLEHYTVVLLLVAL